MLEFQPGINREKPAKTTRFYLAINQTQQQLVVGKISPARERQLQRECRLSTSRSTNDQNSLLASRRHNARTVQIKHSEASQCSTDRKRSRGCKQRIIRTRKLREPDVNHQRSRFFEMDQRVLQRKIQLATACVALSSAGDFKLIQIVRNVGLSIAAKEIDTNVGGSIS